MTKKKEPTFTTLNQIASTLAEAVRPPERLSVSDAAEKYRWINNPGSYVGPWKNETTPYLVEFMDVLTSVDFTGAVFVGPAQTGKTDVLFNWLTHSIICDPADMMIIQTSGATAREFSKTKVDRFLRHTKEAGMRLIKARDSDNVLSKLFRNGMRLSISWPSINELSGKSIRYLWLTDYDRMPKDIDGEGSPFDLARKRATSFRRFGMTVAESTPGWLVENPKWMPETRHEAPPAPGILSLYNRGDRRRWYWQCKHCSEWFEPDFTLLSYPDIADTKEAGRQAVMACPHCGGVHEPKDKYGLNNGGRWLKEGQTIDRDGVVTGIGRKSDIASFWLKGVCAAFADWSSLVTNFIDAERIFSETGDQEPLKVTVNVDQGNPYVPRGLMGGRLPETLKARAEDLGERVVPHGVRWLQASVDVQGNRFEVQVVGIGSGGDRWVIDRFALRKSRRYDEDNERFPLKPHAYLEDWDLLIDEVIQKTYPLADGSGRRMAIKLTCCDSGGRDGVHTNAYSFYRRLRDEYPGNLHQRFQLVRGASYDSAPRIQIQYPDAERKDKLAAARGDVPVLFLNTTIIKDQLNALLDREDPGGGMYHFPDWLPDSFYSELTAETRGPARWENPKSLRNEAWDLLAYDIALSLTRHVRLEHMDWKNPPGWAEEWDFNDMVFQPDDGASTKFAPEPKDAYDLAKIQQLAMELNS